MAKKLSDEYSGKIVELGCHPGYETDDLKEKFKHWGNYNWQKELEKFAPHLRSLVHHGELDECNRAAGIIRSIGIDVSVEQL